MTSIAAILDELKQQRDRINVAIDALEGAKRNGRRKRRTMSAAARARISAAQRARWAKLKKRARSAP